MIHIFTFIDLLNEKTKKSFFIALLLGVLFLLLFIVFFFYYLNSKEILRKRHIIDIDHEIDSNYTNNNNSFNVFNSSSYNNLKLDEFSSTRLLAENDNYSVFINDPIFTNDNSVTTGELIIFNKRKNDLIRIKGEFSFFASTRIFDDGTGKYVLISSGSYNSSNVPISLTKQAIAGKIFCSFSFFEFYKDFIIYENCDAYENRPWGRGEAPSLIALNLITGEEKMIIKSNLFCQYNIKQVLGDTLYFVEKCVEREDDWKEDGNQRDTLKTYNLLSL